MAQQSTPHTQEYIAEQFADRGCELLGVYKNKSTPVAFRCKCGLESTITYGSFRRGSYCLGCSGKKKHTTEEVRQLAESRGCELLSEYTGAHSAITVKCHCGTIYSTVWSNFREGRSCKNCGMKRTAESLRLDISDVAEKFQAAGCELISKIYCGSHKNLDYICVCGRKCKMAFSNFQNGQRCKACRSANMSGDKHHNWQPDRELLKVKRKIQSRCHASLRHMLKKKGIKKQQKSAALLGYSQKDLVTHLTSHPNWSSVKSGVWHIDHIFPIKAFFQYGIYDLAVINALDNLRPLSGEDNMKKHAKYDTEEFERWLRLKGVLCNSKNGWGWTRPDSRG